MATGAATLAERGKAEEGKLPLLEVLVSAWRDPARKSHVLGGAASLVLLVICFWSTLRDLVTSWSTDDNYSHGFLVPLLSLYFANEAAKRGPVPLRGGQVLGSVLIAVALLGKLATILVPIGIVGGMSFLVGLTGVVAVCGGREAVRRYGFALAFLVFMVPLPIALYTMIASPLQMLVSKVSAVFLNLGGIPVLRQGNMMTLPGNVHMFVAEACSGMRQLTGFLALATAVAFLTARPWWYRAMLVAASLPIAMTANVIRVMVTGIIMYRFDPSYASGSFHAVEGLVMMGFGLLMLGGFCSLLSWAFPEGEGQGKQAETGEVGISDMRISRGKGLGRVMPALVLLSMGLAAQAGVERAAVRPRPLLEASLATLPMRLGDWVGEDLETDPEIVRRAQADEYLNRSYYDSRHPGRRLSLWVNYSKHGLNLRHSPEICLPSGGWEKVEARTRVLEVRGGGGKPQQVTRLAYRQGELVQDIGFWYYIFGEGRVEQVVRSLPVTSRSSHGRTTRGSGLTVEIFYPGENDPDGEAIQDFAAALLESLEPMLPGERAAYYRP